jgi:uncharacterized delta-60 repeat protein
MNIPTIKVSSLYLGLCMTAALAAAQAEMVTEAWIAQYNGPANGKDNAQALVRDTAGNAYVTGFSDSGEGNYDFATIKYDSNGKQLWAVRYDGESKGADWPQALALDPGGHVLVTGSSMGEGAAYDITTVKYAADGKQLWVRRYDGPAQGNDRVKALTADGAGNVYVVGDSAGSEGRGEAVILKYSADGDLLWAKRSGALGGDDYAYSAIAVDADGNVYVAGSQTPTGGKSDYLTVKYDPSGEVLWSARRDWSASDDARFVALDVAGNAYVAGASIRYTQGPEKIAHEDVAIVKYAADGSELWTRSINGGAGTNEVAAAMRVDPGGHVYVAATRYGEMPDGSNADFITLKFDADGTELWSAPYQGAGTMDIAHDATLDSVGAVYILGAERGTSDRKSSLVTVKFAPDGSGQWVTRNEGMATAGPGALAVDDHGNIWLTASDAAGQDYLTIKYIQSEKEEVGAAAQGQP